MILRNASRLLNQPMWKGKRRGQRRPIQSPQLNISSYASNVATKIERRLDYPYVWGREASPEMRG
jgi:hypothetical protein